MTEKTALLDYVNKSPSPYHAVAATRAILEENGFEEVHAGEAWSLEPSGAYYMVRGGKTIIAWRMGKTALAETGLRIIGSHSDSPCLKIKPNPVKQARDAALLTTEIYGSPLLHTWLDRDLKIAGAVFHRDGETVSHDLVELPDLRVRANSLAPHLKTEKKVDGVSIDLQKDMAVYFSQDEEAVFDRLMEAVCGGAGIDPSRHMAFDLCLADTQPASLTGRNDEFISAPRLDNLFNAFTSIKALAAAPADCAHTRMAVIYDAEEIGSQTWTGARSDVLDTVLYRINKAYGGSQEDLIRARTKSVFLSADMAHGEHPGFVDSTDPDHVPFINKGLAVKSSARANYAIGHQAWAWFGMICQDAGLPLQKFMYRCDHGGGSSVGPMVSTAGGMCAIDVGAAMLSMHSIREIAGAEDVGHLIAAYDVFYQSTARFTA